MDKEKEIISQANEITNSMSPLDLVQKRCFYLIVQQVRKKYIETDQPTKKYENMIINMTSDTLAKARDEKHVTQAFESLAKLRDQYFKIVTKDFKLVVGIINYAKYIEETKMYEVEVSKEILPYLVDLSRRYFTSYNLTVAITLRHVSTQRFYELCNQYKHKAGMKFFIDADQLRNMLMLDGKYVIYALTINPMKQPKSARNIPDIGFTFTRMKPTNIKSRHSSRRNNKLCISTKFACQSLRGTRSIATGLTNGSSCIRTRYRKCSTRQKDYKGADLAKIIRFALKEDFGIQ